MITSFDDIPYMLVEFDKNGNGELKQELPANCEDVIVVSHGWNNNQEEAENLYRRLFSNMVQVAIDHAEVMPNDKRTIIDKTTILGVIWPSKKFDELMTDLPDEAVHKDGALSGNGDGDAEFSKKKIQEALNKLKTLYSADPNAAPIIESLRALAETIETDTNSQAEFVQQLRQLFNSTGGMLDQEPDDASDRFLYDDKQAVFDNAMREPAPEQAFMDSKKDLKEVRAANFFGRLVSAPVRAVVSLLNMTTYYEMKRRAGIVGREGVARMLDDIGAHNHVKRIHLVGHSFGARVVTAAAMQATTEKIHSMSLLQAAFSHNAFSESEAGFFRNVIRNKKVKGAVIVTHTANDRAVGLAYPIASRLARDAARGILGGPDDKYGGLGRNGAQKMNADEVFADTSKLLQDGATYQFRSEKIHNLEGSDYIRANSGGDAHGEVYGKEVAWAILSAMTNKV